MEASTTPDSVDAGVGDGGSAGDVPKVEGTETVPTSVGVRVAVGAGAGVGVGVGVAVETRTGGGGVSVGVGVCANDNAAIKKAPSPRLATRDRFRMTKWSVGSWMRKG